MAFATLGVYIAIGLAVGSVVLARNAGMAFDLAVMRAVFVFVLFTALAFGAEAVLSAPGAPRAAPPPANPVADPSTAPEDESA